MEGDLAKVDDLRLGLAEGRTAGALLRCRGSSGGLSVLVGRSTCSDLEVEGLRRPLGAVRDVLGHDGLRKDRAALGGGVVVSGGLVLVDDLCIGRGCRQRALAVVGDFDRNSFLLKTKGPAVGTLLPCRVAFLRLNLLHLVGVGSGLLEGNDAKVDGLRSCFINGRAALGAVFLAAGSIALRCQRCTADRLNGEVEGLRCPCGSVCVDRLLQDCRIVVAGIQVSDRLIPVLNLCRAIVHDCGQVALSVVGDGDRHGLRFVVADPALAALRGLGQRVGVGSGLRVLQLTEADDLLTGLIEGRGSVDRSCLCSLSCRSFCRCFLCVGNGGQREVEGLRCPCGSFRGHRLLQDCAGIGGGIQLAFRAVGIRDLSFSRHRDGERSILLLVDRNNNLVRFIVADPEVITRRGLCSFLAEGRASSRNILSGAVLRQRCSANRFDLELKGLFGEPKFHGLNGLRQDRRYTGIQHFRLIGIRDRDLFSCRGQSSVQIVNNIDRDRMRLIVIDPGVLIRAGRLLFRYSVAVFTSLRVLNGTEADFLRSCLVEGCGAGGVHCSGLLRQRCVRRIDCRDLELEGLRRPVSTGRFNRLLKNRRRIGIQLALRLVSVGDLQRVILIIGRIIMINRGFLDRVVVGVAVFIILRKILIGVCGVAPGCCNRSSLIIQDFFLLRASLLTLSVERQADFRRVVMGLVRILVHPDLFTGHVDGLCTGVGNIFTGDIIIRSVPGLRRIVVVDVVIRVFRSLARDLALSYRIGIRIAGAVILRKSGI